MEAYSVQTVMDKRRVATRLRPVLSTLRAFAGAALYPPTPLARAIVFVLWAKFFAVTAMLAYLHFTGQQHVVDGADTMNRLLGSAAPK
jgi:hypothetical protein